jgi:hypothetical protein
MGALSFIVDIALAILRQPLRLLDWVKAKLGYVNDLPLREFVYLDETSVISLIASTTGGITEHKSTVKRRQISGSIKGGLGDKTSSLGATVGATKEKSSEAVRRYVIQSNFKELYEMRATDMVISDEYDPSLSVPRRAWNGLTSIPSRVRDSGAEEDEPEPPTEVEFRRGDLAEVNVNLGSHEVYNFYTAVGSMAEMFDLFPEDSEMSQQLDTEEFSMGELGAFSELIDHLLAGLVPIVGEVEDYVVVMRDEEPIIVRKQDATDDGEEYEPLNIVGFVDSEKFWQEETRFLFDDDEYTVYCRLDGDEVSNDWMPIKLLSVVESIIPELGESVGEIPETFERVNTADPSTSKNEVELRPRLHSYLEELEDAGLDINADEVNDVLDAVLAEFGGTSSRVEGIEDAIGELEDELEQRGYQYDIDPERRLEVMGDLLSEDLDTLSRTGESNEWYLEVSFTAIYW